ncbi:MAG: hypothetical protein ACOCT0_06360, partial [Halobacteriota archaeon]
MNSSNWTSGFGRVQVVAALVAAFAGATHLTSSALDPSPEPVYVGFAYLVLAGFVLVSRRTSLALLSLTVYLGIQFVGAEGGVLSSAALVEGAPAA